MRFSPFYLLFLKTTQISVMGRMNPNLFVMYPYASRIYYCTDKQIKINQELLSRFSWKFIKDQLRIQTHLN